MQPRVRRPGRALVRARRRGQRGAAAVEFALVLPVLALLIFGTVQYGYYFFASQSGSSVLREAARKVSVGDCVTQAQVKAYIDNRLNSVYHKPTQVTLSYSSTPAAVGSTATVTLQFDTLNLRFPGIPMPGDATVTRTAETRVEDLNSQGCT